jgi:hypothetical protein
MIICGFPGIGKSTLALNTNNKFIDLESSCFYMNNGNRPEEWYVCYAKVATDLSRQGYCVFTSTHEHVREYINKCSNSTDELENKLLYIYPCLELEGKWIKRLEDRYNKTKLEKDKRALDAITGGKYFDLVFEAMRDILIPNHLEINDINYNLEELIKPYMQ